MKRDLFATGFVAEDFELCKDELSYERMCQRAAHLANNLLAEAKRDSVRVYGTWSGEMFIQKPEPSKWTHQALLIAVEEIK